MWTCEHCKNRNWDSASVCHKCKNPISEAQKIEVNLNRAAELARPKKSITDASKRERPPTEKPQLNEETKISSESRLAVPSKDLPSIFHLVIFVPCALAAAVIAVTIVGAIFYGVY